MDQNKRKKEEELQYHRAGIGHFLAERVDLAAMILVLSILISVIEPKFQLLMYLVIVAGGLLFAYGYLAKPQDLQEEPEEENKDILDSSSAYGFLQE
jgi:hypothetical protein